MILIRIFFFFLRKVLKEPLVKVSATACKVQTTIPVDIRRETVEILNRILPPKEWEEDGQIWSQSVKFKTHTYINYITTNGLLI